MIPAPIIKPNTQIKRLTGVNTILNAMSWNYAANMLFTTAALHTQLQCTEFLMRI